MNRIELRGVIVPSMYDSDWAQGYITKGMITPESAFRRQLAAASAEEPLTVYVNSPGGSVFAAYEMINALQTWKAENKQPVNVVIGAMAASAASALSIMAGTEIRAFKNSKMMFHGASTYTEGGKGAHDDNADLLGKINADIMAALTTRYNVNPDTVAGWFEEGRAGWLNAAEMQAAGIISGIEDSDDNVIELDEGAMAEMNGKGLDIAAMLEGETKDESGSDGAGNEQEPEKAGEGAGDSGNGSESGAAAVAGAGEPDGGAGEVALTPAEIAVAVADAIGVHAVAMQELRAKFEASEKTCRTLQSHRDRLEVELKAAKDQAVKDVSNMQDALAKANAKIVRFLGAATTFSPEPAEPADWLEALALCNGNAEDARKRYNDLRIAYNKKQQEKREAKR